MTYTFITFIMTYTFIIFIMTYSFITFIMTYTFITFIMTYTFITFIMTYTFITFITTYTFITFIMTYTFIIFITTYTFITFIMTYTFITFIMTYTFITFIVTYTFIITLHGQEEGIHTPTLYNADNLTCTNPNFLNITDAPIWHNYANTLLQFLTGTGWMEKTPLYIGWYMPLNITNKNIKYRESGCKPDDRYRCRTFDNPIEGEGDEAKRKYNEIEFDGEDKDHKEDFTEGKLDCDINCPTTIDKTLSAEERQQCSIKCYKCGDSCDDIDRSVARWLSMCLRLGIVYNFALAYVLVGLSYFLLSLLFIIKNMMKLFKKSAIEIVGYNPYSELVFGGWDYNIENKESAILKSKSILKSLKEELTSDDQKEKLVSTKEKVLLALLRMFTNVLCLAAMGGVFYLYYDVYDKKEATNPCGSQDGDTIDINNITSESLNGMWKSYGPAVIVSASNVIFPIFFEFVGNMEMYQFQSTRINITMARSFVTKLFSVVAYLYILYDTIQKTQDKDAPKDTDWTYNCWENFIGTELYRLIIIDFAVFVIALLTTEWLRRLMVENNRFIREKLGITQFNITKEVLDICYKQMIFWSALFFSPLVSVVAFVEIVLMFYFKKISALRNVRPPEKVILNSSSSSIINIVFIISLLVVFVPIGLIIFTFNPSSDCGPFQGHDKFIDPLNTIIDKSGSFKEIILDNLKMTSVVVVIVVVTVIVIHFFYSLSAARQLTIQLLREQIKVENADKKFLIEQMKNSRNPQSSSELIAEDKIVHFKILSPTPVDKTRVQHNLVWYQSKFDPDKGKNKKKNSNVVGSYANPNVRKKR
ncbi:transmembrane channel-like protein 7 [Bolinopsis microptera]|uniref:transmembrane channel-like protein 7 n=1 Tax=Bolinopsis microptera TaxID=2820187 RepID=UPI00307A62DE